MLSPLHAAAVAAVLGHKRRCPVCAKAQFTDRLDEHGRYRCKKCGHIFTANELKKTS